MALTARFRPGATRRPFVDREPVIELFDELVARSGEPQVLVLTGLGGIGKSRLVTELRSRLTDRYASAVLDLQVPAQRQPEAALATLRAEFGRQQVSFHRFDIAYAVLWQRLHPHLRITADGLPLVAQSEILTEILDAAAGLPVFGTAAKLLDSGSRRLRRWQTVRRDPTLSELDLLSLPRLVDAVSYLFAEDLKARGGPYALFVDAYDALVGGVERVGWAAADDGWLRDIVAQLDTAIVVVASREPLGWEIHDPEWATRLRTVDVTDLPMAAREELLAVAGITDPTERRAIAISSAGVPFYLHLALDAHGRLPTGDARITVSPEAILERFLRHVEPAQVRALELLSVARTIDGEIFATVATEFGVPSGRLAWQSMVGYSFVYGVRSGTDVGEGTEPTRFRLHQLMLRALQRRLTPALVISLHRLLYQLWQQRSVEPGQRVPALREAVYHGVRAGEVGAAELLGYVDQIAAAGGKRGIDGVLADLLDHLADMPAIDREHAELAELARCLEVEAALLLGDAAGGVELTRDLGPVRPGPVAERLAVAAGNARRILGRTDEALAIFRTVWASGTTRARLTAGLWAADLDMCQGRFADALALTEELGAACPPDDDEFHGDLARLRSLAYRFGADLAGADRQLVEAERRYAAAGSVIGAANIATNRAELLAFADPESAIPAVGVAIEAQRELGALHEQGKAYTALGVARLMLGDLAAAEHALDAGCDALERANYRSGRARAELFRAALRIRQGRRADAVASARTAVAELGAAAVYPTLVMLADAMFGLAGWPDPDLAVAAARCGRQVQPFVGGPTLSEALGRQAGRLIGVETDDLYREAINRSDLASGFYNHNVQVDTVAGVVNVRVAVPGADQMDLRIWPEAEVLRALASHVPRVPRVRFASADPAFQVQDHIEGVLLDEMAPRGVAVPAQVPHDVATLFGRLSAVPAAERPAGWPADGDTPGFAARLSAVTETVYAAHAGEFGALFGRLGIPARPVEAAIAGWAGLAARPFRLVHADVHRKNMIVADGVVWFLDWELALWGDPVYDVASHLHKMAYLPAEQETFLAAWERAEPAAAGPGWQDDLSAYLRHERVKSAVVDTVRYSKLIAAGGCSPDQERAHPKAGRQAAGGVRGVGAAGGQLRRGRLAGDPARRRAGVRSG
ncbi:MAG: phosphotransferase [Actinobacteria bacterium]|nr:phosphotransferase [Actinomycetota bacterium]